MQIANNWPHLEWNDRRGPRLPEARLQSGLWKVSRPVEPDKWPLALARPWGLATVLSVRRRRVSFDGNRQIAKNENARGAPSPEIPQTTGWGELARPWASRQLVDEIF